MPNNPNYKSNYTDLYAFLEGAQPGTGRNANSSGSDIINNKFGFYPNQSRTGSFNINGKDFGDTLNGHSETLPKGFIRNLVTNQGGALAKFPNIRCNFQFNPQDIQHQIEARRDMYLPILQDPSQLSQPMAGNASFAFELIFDRTMEVNSSRSRSVDNMPDPNSAETVGVFHDLRVLFSIIGQGLSSELMDAQLAKLKQDVKNYASKNYSELNIQASTTMNNGVTSYNFDAVTPEGATAPDPNSQATANFLKNIDLDPDDKVKNFMTNINIGNSAFLIPQPCRVVFSPMFMVDGFVMNTNILFTKFSAKMIPIQCKIYLQMQAVYIGFARAKTFITEQIQQTIDENNTDQTSYDSNKITLANILAENLRSITVSYCADERSLSNGGVDEATSDFSLSITSTKTGKNRENFGLVYQPFWLFATRDFWYNRPYDLVGTASSFKPQASSGGDGYDLYDPRVILDFNNPVTTPYGGPGLTIKYCDTSTNVENIKSKVFDDLSSDNASFSPNIYTYIYGPFNSQSEATTFKATVSTVASSGLPDSDTVGFYSAGPKYSDSGAWDDFSKKPKNQTLGLNNWDPVYNGANNASNPITKITKNSSGKSVKDALDERILTMNSLDRVQAGLLYSKVGSMTQENSDPVWDDKRESSNSSTGVNKVPLDIYTKLPNSLLELVDEVHDLSNKYFVVITQAAVFYNILNTNASSTNASVALARDVSIVKGDTTNFTVTVHPTYTEATAVVPV